MRVLDCLGSGGGKKRRGGGEGMGEREGERSFPFSFFSFLSFSSELSYLHKENSKRPLWQAQSSNYSVMMRVRLRSVPYKLWHTVHMFLVSFSVYSSHPLHHAGVHEELSKSIFIPSTWYRCTRGVEQSYPPFFPGGGESSRLSSSAAACCCRRAATLPCSVRRLLRRRLWPLLRSSV